jgi:hypothetical protein
MWREQTNSDGRREREEEVRKYEEKVEGKVPSLELDNFAELRKALSAFFTYKVEVEDEKGLFIRSGRSGGIQNRSSVPDRCS